MPLPWKNHKLPCVEEVINTRTRDVKLFSATVYIYFSAPFLTKSPPQPTLWKLIWESKKEKKKFQWFLYPSMNEFMTFWNNTVKCRQCQLELLLLYQTKMSLYFLGESACCYASESTHHCRSGLLSVGNTIEKHPYETYLNNPMPEICLQQGSYISGFSIKIIKN